MPAIFLRTRDGVLDPGQRQAFAELEQRLASGGRKVLLHLHGGLVNEAQGVAIAERLSGREPDGFGLAPDWEQIYVVWRTGALETIRDNWTDLFENDRLYKVLLKRVLGFVADKLGVPSLGGRSAFSSFALTPAEITARLEAHPGGNPFGDVDLLISSDSPAGRGPTLATQSDAAIIGEITLSLQLDPEFNAAAEDIAAALTVDPISGRSAAPHGDPSQGGDSFGRLDAEVRTALRPLVAGQDDARALFSALGVTQFFIKHAAAIVLRVIRRFRKGRDHGFYATVVEELARELYGDLVGSTVWQMMKKDAAQHFGPAGLGSELLGAVTSASNNRLAVTAHSAGAIWVTRMLEAMVRSSRSSTFDLALLAPAVRMDLFAKAVEAGGGRIDRLRVFTMADALERADPVLGEGYGYIYPSSLLYLISGLFEAEADGDAFVDAPLLGLQRFLIGDPSWVKEPGQEAAIRGVTRFLTFPNHGVVYSQVSAGPGLSSQAKSHGGFDSEPVTVASIAHFLE
jgi:hypothetical protein